MILLIVICYGNLTGTAWGYVFSCVGDKFCALWLSFGLSGPCQCQSKTVQLISDTAPPVSISISTHLWLMPINIIRGSIFFCSEMQKSLCTEAVSPELIVCMASSYSSLSTLCVWRFLVPLVPLLFWQITEMWPVFWQKMQVSSLKWQYSRECLSSHRKLVFAFSSTGISSIDAAYIWLHVSVVVLEQAAMMWTCLSARSIARAICLAWSKFNLFSPINVCGFGRPQHLQPASSLTYPR